MGTKHSLGAVLCLRTKGRYWGENLARCEILLRSLEHFAEPRLLQPFIVVVPPEESSCLRKALAGWRHLGLEVVDERAICPGLAWHRGAGGWRKQQVLKLAVARHLDAPYYLTLDPDVFATHPLTLEQLFPAGRALIDLGPRDRFQRPYWWVASARLLGVEPALDEPGIAVTPVLLSRAIVEGLLESLEGGTPGSWVHRLLTPHNWWNPVRFWPGHEPRHCWSEYTLYYLFARSRGLIETFHSSDKTRLLSLSSVHRSEDFALWNPEDCFGAQNPALFSLVQSSQGIPAREVWARLEPYLT